MHVYINWCNKPLHRIWFTKLAIFIPNSNPRITAQRDSECGFRKMKLFTVFMGVRLGQGRRATLEKMKHQKNLGVWPSMERNIMPQENYIKSEEREREFPRHNVSMSKH